MNDHTTARDRILARLHAAGTHLTEVPAAPLPPRRTLDRDARIEQLAALMTAMRTEVHVVDAERWIETLTELAARKGWQRVLYGPGSPIGDAVAAAWGAAAEDRPALVPYDASVETFKEDLFFNIDVGLTGTRGALADTGALVLWPTAQEPRLMSLVPPVHVAVLDADAIQDSLADMMSAENWSDGMPTNALLVSGPSKTADIEFTLVFGVHGPKELILLIRK